MLSQLARCYDLNTLLEDPEPRGRYTHSLASSTVSSSPSTWILTPSGNCQPSQGYAISNVPGAPKHSNRVPKALTIHVLLNLRNETFQKFLISVANCQQSPVRISGDKTRFRRHPIRVCRCLKGSTRPRYCQHVAGPGVGRGLLSGTLISPHRTRSLHIPSN